MPDFRLPDLGEGLTEAEVVTWRVSPGDAVEVDQVVVDVETAKAVVEVPVPFAGTVTRLHAQPGDVVTVGAPLISVNTAPSSEREDASARASEGASGQVLVGYGTSESARQRHRASRPRATRQPAAPAVAAGSEAATSEEEPRSVAVISPLVRKLARDAGLDVREIGGTGLDGVVLRRDVERALARASDGARRRPMRGIRRTVAEKLARAHREIPDATVWVDVDATALLAARAQLNARTTESPISLLALLSRFAILGLGRYPELNARVNEDEIVIPETVRLGFAAQTDRGLVVPVVPDAHRMTTRELSAALRSLTDGARAGMLSPSDLTGGTFTVNNYGIFGVDGSAAIINHPEVAILGIGRIIERPWVVDGQLAVRQVAELTLTFDHRVCDGGTAGGFLRFVADCVEAPIRVVGDL
jgi:2-oxoisovalerate dehydrogenase E2 component (dihydrolipoyl transacylase)